MVCYSNGDLNTILCIWEFMLKGEKYVFSGNKTLSERFGANLKNPFLHVFAANLSLFALFQLLSKKNIENTYFHQHLECTAQKRWSKYTTSKKEWTVIWKFRVRGWISILGHAKKDVTSKETINGMSMCVVYFDQL